MSFEDRVKDWCGEFRYVFEVDATEEESGLSALHRVRDSGIIQGMALEGFPETEEQLRDGDPEIDEAIIRLVKGAFDAYGASTYSDGTDMIGGLMVLLQTARQWGTHFETRNQILMTLGSISPP